MIRPTGGFGTDRAIIPGAACKFGAILNATPFRADPRVSLQIIYRIYFAMPKIPEIAPQHKLCVAKNSKTDHATPPQGELDRTDATSSLRRSLRDRHGLAAARDLKRAPRPEKNPGPRAAP